MDGKKRMVRNYQRCVGRPSWFCLDRKYTSLGVSSARSISLSNSQSLYPLLKKCCSRSEVLLRRFNSSKQILQRDSAWLQGMAVLQCFRWQLSMQWYWCLSVGLVCRSVSIRPFSGRPLCLDRCLLQLTKRQCS